LKSVSHERQRNAGLPVHGWSLLLHGSKRNEALSLAEIEQYGFDSFGDADYISLYGMSPREWYACGIRLLGRTAVECTRDALADRIGRDIVSVAANMPSNQLVVLDPFAGSCNTLFWILRHLPNSEGIGFESDRRSLSLRPATLRPLSRGSNLSKATTISFLQSIACQKVEESSPLSQPRGAPPSMKCKP